MTKINFYNISDTEKSKIFKEISNKIGMPAFAVEKDWWVVQTLSIIFDMEIADKLVFKGGTSLSKAWKLIDRFSEDIDLAVDRTFFNFEGELSKKEKTNLRKQASKYISERFYPELKNNFIKLGFNDLDIRIIEPLSSDQDPRIIDIYYPSVIETPGYIQAKVQVEIGTRSLREPFSIKSIKTLIDEEYPNAVFSQSSVKIPTVNPERTFLEKIFLLHEEFQRPIEKIRVNRLSRHLYDIYQLIKTDFGEKAFNDKALYETIVKHRYNLTKVGGVNYNLHQPQTLNPIPTKEFISKWQKDYETMQEQMIYGDSPSFKEIINVIQVFIEQINSLKWKINYEFPLPKIT